MNETCNFDQLKISCDFDGEESFRVNSISVMERPVIMKKSLGTHDFEISESIPMAPRVNSGVLSGAIEGQLEDGKYMVLTNADDLLPEVDVEFDFRLPRKALDNATCLQFRLVGHGDGISLGSGTYRLMSVNDSKNERIYPFFQGGDELTFTINPDQFYKYFNGDACELAFRVSFKSATPFIIFIDSLRLMSFKDWSANHDLYRATFKFEKLSDTQSGKLELGVNDLARITIDDDDLMPVGYTNIVSFNYDFKSMEWTAFLNENKTNLLELVQEEPVFRAFRPVEMRRGF